MSTSPVRRVLLCCVLAGALGSCRTPPPAPAPPQEALPAPVPVVIPPRVDLYRIDPDASQVLVLVYRDGPMARLGHNHIISVHELTGEVTVPEQRADARFWIEFPVAAMSVDDPALRTELGEDFRAPIDPGSVRGTREHMLGEKVLNALQFPKIRLESGPLRADGDHWLVTLQISARGHSSNTEVPVQLAISPQELTASGEFELTHAQLGLTPYSIGHGALRVAETMHVRFHLTARLDADSDAGRQAP